MRVDLDALICNVLEREQVRCVEPQRSCARRRASEPWSSCHVVMQELRSCRTFAAPSHTLEMNKSAHLFP
jgi:hypothetical protein